MATEERYWPDLTAYGLSLWLSREAGNEDSPPRYRFQILAQDDLSPEQALRNRAPLASLAAALMGAPTKTEPSRERGSVQMEWVGLRVPVSRVFLESFPHARIRSVASLAVGPWRKDLERVGKGLPIAQFWWVAEPDADRVTAAPGGLERNPYALWSLTPEGAAAYGHAGEAVTRTSYQDRGGPILLGREPRNGGFWTIPHDDLPHLAPGDEVVRSIVAADTKGVDRADAGEKIGGARKDRAMRSATEDGVGVDAGTPWDDRSFLEINDRDALRKVAGSMRRDIIWKPPSEDDAADFLENGGTVAAWYFREMVRKNVAASPLTLHIIAGARRSKTGAGLSQIKMGMMVYPPAVARLRDIVQTWRTMDDVLRDVLFLLTSRDADVSAAWYQKEALAALGTMPAAVLSQILTSKKDWIHDDARTTASLVADRIEAIVAGELPEKVQSFIAAIAPLWMRATDEKRTLADAVEDVTKEVAHFNTWGWMAASRNIWRLAFKCAIVERVVSDVTIPHESRLALSDALIGATSKSPRPHADPVEGTGIPRREMPSPRFQNLKREGPARRVGPITEEILLSTFGLRAVEYGNWVKGADRQAMLDGTYDALFDMAEALAVPPSFMGFHGRLGLALGARGRGGTAAAHYERDRKVINLTKTLGSGTLAHEWSHALDHWWAEACGSHGFASEMCAADPAWWLHHEDERRPAMGEFFRAITIPVSAPDGTSESSRQRRLRIFEDLVARLSPASNSNPAQLAAYQAVVRWILEEVAPNVVAAGERSASTMLAQYFCKPGGVWTFSPDLIAQQVERFIEASGGTPLGSDAFLEASRRVPYKAFRAAWKDLGKRKAVTTDFAADAASLGTYWSRPCELFARAFSAVIHDRMADRGVINDFASKFSAPRIFLSKQYKASPNPEGVERQAFQDAAIPFVAMIQEASSPAPAVREPRPAPAADRAAAAAAVAP